MARRIVCADRHQKAMAHSYIRQPAEIYKRSFEIVREEADLANLPPAMRPVVTRLIHSCGMVDLIDDLQFSENAAEIGRSALLAAAPIYCDVEMVRSGIIGARLPAKNDVLCTLNDPRTREHAKQMDTTRSAAAVDLVASGRVGRGHWQRAHRFVSPAGED